MSRSYGCKKSKLDNSCPRVIFTQEHVKSARVQQLNSTVFDLRTMIKLPQALSDIDQGQLGSCTANAIAFAICFDEIKQGNAEVFMPSRLFIYYNERKMEGTVDQDSGAEIHDGVKSINLYGYCDEHKWVYDPTKFASEPPTSLYSAAKLSKAVGYASIDFTNDKTVQARVNHLKTALRSGFPVVFGFTVYDSFESDAVAKTGMMPMPGKHEKQVGGHAVAMVGYDDSKQCFIVKNSWGPDWGLNNYFYMPYNYAGDANLADDFWVIRSVSNPTKVPGWAPGDIEPDATNLDVSPTDNGGVVNPDNSNGGGNNSDSDNDSDNDNN